VDRGAGTIDQPAGGVPRLERLAEPILIVVLTIGALAVRWPMLWLVPAFSDETLEARLAIAVYRGDIDTLTGVDPYIGSGWNYLLAGLFHVFGLSPWLPRATVLVIGVLSVPAVWWLAREIGGPRVASVATAFFAFCSTHILVNSHVGWSHSTTPLFATLGFASLWRGCHRNRSGAWLVAAALLLGVAVQTHITALLLLPGALMVVAWRRPAILVSRWCPLAVFAFALATWNLILFNVITGGESLSGGARVTAEYTGEELGFDLAAYPENLWRLALGSSWVLSGAIEKRRYVGESLLSPLPLAYLSLAVGSILWATRRGSPLPLFVVGTFAALLPLVNPKYEPLLNGRYVMPLLPLVYAAIGLAVVALSQKVIRPHIADHGWRTLLPATALTVVVALTAVYPWLPMRRYLRTTERTNHAIFLAFDTVRSERQPTEVVLLDVGLDSVFYMAAGSAYRGMELLLDGSDTPYQVIDARQASLSDAMAGQQTRLALIASDKLTPLSRSFTLTPLGDAWRGPGFGVYRVSRR
jgi:4-amino-4-deoxy-L-arabinose transferase-like glycosyltransferase